MRVPAIVSPRSVRAIVAFSLDAEVITLTSQKLLHLTSTTLLLSPHRVTIIPGRLVDAEND